MLEEPVELLGVWLLVGGGVEVEGGLSRKEGNMLLVVVEVIGRLGLSSASLEEGERTEAVLSGARGVSSKIVRLLVLREGLGVWARPLGLDE